MNQTATVAQAINQKIASSEEILVITHVGPDGDALGSLTAVGQILAARNKRFTLACDDGMRSRFSYLALADQVEQKPRQDRGYDLLIAVDCGDERRMGNAFSNLPTPKPVIINIDHHPTNTCFGEINLIDSVATSTTEILYDLFVAMGDEIDRETAVSLLTGLVTDTLGFRTVGVTARTMKIASALIDAGANLAAITTNALNLHSKTIADLWRIGLNNMQIDGKLAWSSLTHKELRQIDYTDPSSAGLVNFLANIDTVGIGVVLFELSDGAVRVGFRSRPPYDVASIALSLGGGGHKLASGCTIDGPLEEARALVLRRTREAIQQTEAG